MIKEENMSEYFDKKIPKFPYGQLAIINLNSFAKTGKLVDRHVVELRKDYLDQSSTVFAG